MNKVLTPVLKEDLLDYRFLSGVSCSPYEDLAVFTVAKQDTKTNSYKKNLWMADLQTGKLSQLTYHGKARSFIFEKAGSLLCAVEAKNKKPGHTGFAHFDLTTKKSDYAFTLPFAVNQLWPLGENVYLVNANVDTNQEGMTDEEKAAEADYIPIRELPFWDNGIGYVSGWRDILYVYDAAQDKLFRLTDLDFNVAATALSADKKTLWFTGQSFTEKKGRHNGLFKLDLETAAIDTIIPQDFVRLGKLQLVGDTLFVSASYMDKWGTADKDDWYVLQDGELCKVLDNDFTLGCNVAGDCRFGGGKNSAEYMGKLLYLTTEVKQCLPNTLTAEGEHAHLFPFDGAIDCLSVKDEKIVFVAMKKQSLQELYLFDGQKVRQLSHFNRTALKGKYVAKPEYCGFTNSEGVHIDGWYLKPIDFDPEKQYPALLSMHGGPCVAWGELFVHEMQMLAGMGYFVFFCNPRGSDGRGARFAHLRGKYGTVDYEDFMEFTDHVTDTIPQIDTGKLGVLGGSYGGYMTNWIIGHTDRFAAAVSQRSFCNPISDFGNSCLGYTFDVDQFAGTPWDNLDRLWDHAPLKYAPDCTTPTLFIHALEDYNCPLSQGFEMFSALKYHGVICEMVLFKGENHELSRSGKPLHRMRRLSEIIRWFDTYLG